MLRLLIKIPYWLYWIAALASLALACWYYIMGMTLVLGPDPLEPGPATEFVDLAEFDPNTHLSPKKEVVLMAQINGKIDTALGKTGEDQIERFAYILFPAIARPGEKNVRAVVVTSDRAGFEDWMTDRIIGNAQMGALYTIPGRKLDNRRVQAAVIGRLSELGMTSASEFVLIQPGFELPRERQYLTPPKEKLILPILLISATGILLIFGFHARSMQKRIFDDGAIDPILAVDRDPDDIPEIPER